MAKRKSLKTPRKKAFLQQKGRCYYCSSPMWLEEHDITQFCNEYQLTLRQAQKFKCTGEHLVPHKNGGDNSAQNIVAACNFCNSKRHARNSELTPRQYANLVQSRVKAGRWTSGLMNTNLLQRAV